MSNDPLFPLMAVIGQAVAEDSLRWAWFRYLMSRLPTDEQERAVAAFEAGMPPDSYERSGMRDGTFAARAEAIKRSR